jgi:hypothetical protein
MADQDEEFDAAGACAYLLRKHRVTRAVATLAKAAWTGQGPVFRKKGKFRIYTAAGLDAYVASITSPPTRKGFRYRKEVA